MQKVPLLQYLLGLIRGERFSAPEAERHPQAVGPPKRDPATETRPHTESVTNIGNLFQEENHPIWEERRRKREREDETPAVFAREHVAWIWKVRMVCVHACIWVSERVCVSEYTQALGG